MIDNEVRPPPVANMRLHPALIILGALAVQLAGSYLWTLDSDWAQVRLVPGLGRVLMGVGVATLILAYTSMARANTTLDPRQHTSAIVSTGIYRLSRNPIYLGWFLFLLGRGVANLNPFQGLTALGMIVLLHWAVVLHEERYLADTFGNEYLRYRDRVRRWL